ncbi:MAG: ABC transporter permease, partial [Myxococcota bacterium]
TSESRTVGWRAFSSRDLVRVEGRRTPDEAILAFRGDGVRAVVVAPPGFSRDLERDRGELQVLVDASDGSAGSQTLAKLESALQASMRRPRPLNGRVDVQVRTLFNPESKSALFLVPGLAAYVVAIICVLLTALTVAREWELGSMEQLFATPVGRFEIVVGKLLPYLGLGLAAVTLVLSAGAVVFGVPFRGSLLAVALGSLLFVLGMLAQGLLISIVTKNQMVATQAAALSSMLPSMLLSGFLFPIENMPGVLQLITLGVPARHYIEILRGALLRGNSLWDLLEPIAALGAFSVALILISTVRFQRRLA